MAVVAIVGSQESFISAVAEAFIAQIVEASEAAARITVVAPAAVTMASIRRTADTGQHKLELEPTVISSDQMSMLKFIAIMAAVVEEAAIGHMQPMGLAELQRHQSAGLIDQMLAHS